ncbi:amino-acid N-acetyltransferase [Saccharopolyspora hirsuta]|uniref:Amino-acid N-acetyltransferase n=1 Tax=Saccharopolyspora hirsuta TaxID=1837 RepID=A0A5M7BMT0_SACHI|nr:amino-acid N-acetyltransferase [Saccharopolyspora hirsuta]KAA5831109.1 amino-acid N-acetyltransferase [Saccharopolyspora hirsuta]
MNDYASSAIAIRRARIADVPAIKALVDTYAGEVLLAKNLVTLYEDVQEFWVAELTEPDRAARVVGCGALHVLWEDLAEIRTVAVDPSVKGGGIGHRLVQQLVALARELGLARLFVLTFETEFFGKHGFRTVDGAPVSPEVYEEMRRSVDAGVAEFLDLANIKPNTLGNTRMLLDLT